MTVMLAVVLSGSVMLGSCYPGSLGVKQKRAARRIVRPFEGSIYSRSVVPPGRSSSASFC
jgi:hypothetical protein